MTSKKNYGINIGTSSILVIIVILCLVCFAGLSITSASADFRLSKKLAERTTAYYTACNQAEERLSLLDSSLLKLYLESEDEADYFQKIKESLSDSLTFSCSINDTQFLSVAVTPLYPDSPDSYETKPLYRITSYQVKNTAVQQPDNSLPVLLRD